MNPIAKNGSGRTDWQFYIQLLLPMILTAGGAIVASGVPALIAYGEIQATVETMRDDMRSLKIEVREVSRAFDKLEHIQSDVTAIETAMPMYLRKDEHREIHGGLVRPRP